MVKKGKTIPVNAYRKLGSCYSSIGVLEQYIASGTVNGFNFAIICYQSDRRDACGYNHCIYLDKPFSFRLRIDLTKYEECIRELLYGDSKAYQTFCTSGKFHVGNVSPSLWNNGFGRCEYAESTIILYKGFAEKKQWELSVMKEGVDWFHPTRVQVRNLVKSKLETVEPFINDISKRGKILTPDFNYWNF